MMGLTHFASACAGPRRWSRWGLALLVLNEIRGVIFVWLIVSAWAAG